MGLTLVRGVCFLIIKNSSCFSLLTVILKAVYQCLCSYLSPYPLFFPLFRCWQHSAVRGQGKPLSSSSYVCRYNPAVAKDQLRRCRCLWKLSRCLNLLFPVRVTLSTAIWKMKQNARAELKQWDWETMCTDTAYYGIVRNLFVLITGNLEVLDKAISKLREYLRLRDEQLAAFWAPHILGDALSPEG